MVKCHWIKHSSLEGYVRDVVASILKGIECGKQLLRIFFRWLKFANHGFKELHFRKHICKNYLSLMPQFLPRLKPVGFLEATR